MNLKSIKTNLQKTIRAKKFWLIVSSISIGYLLIAAIVTSSLLAGNTPTLTPAPPSLAQHSEASEASQPPVNGYSPIRENIEEDTGNFLRPPARTNVLIVGLDHARLADVIIVGSFERDTGEINLLSIPRDTFTQLPQHRIDNMTDNGLWVPGTLKINALRSLSRDFGPHFLKEQLSETLGLEIHYYVEMNLAAFRDIVDIIGGVEIEVPRRLHYYDPYQNLLIDIPAGTHQMDGRMAEHFVRYRDVDGDLGRINAQQRFMTQLFRQALRRESVMNDPVGLTRVALRNVDTNIGLDLFRYIPYIPNLDPNNIHTYMLPGEGGRINGISYFIPDSKRVPEVINRMFFGITPEPDEDALIQVIAHSGSNSRNAQISILNGTRVGGVARDIADRLHADGYNIAHVGVFSGSQENRTRINVREEGLGEDLLAYFADAVISVDPRIDFDIVIVVGRSEQ